MCLFVRACRPGTVGCVLVVSYTISFNFFSFLLRLRFGFSFRAHRCRRSPLLLLSVYTNGDHDDDDHEDDDDSVHFASFARTHAHTHARKYQSGVRLIIARRPPLLNQTGTVPSNPNVSTSSDNPPPPSPHENISPSISTQPPFSALSPPPTDCYTVWLPAPLPGCPRPRPYLPHLSSSSSSSSFSDPRAGFG